MKFLEIFVRLGSPDPKLWRFDPPSFLLVAPPALELIEERTFSLRLF